MPDQDILNALYGEKTLPLEDAIWNYDARNYSSYLLRSGGVYDMQWVIAAHGDTAFLRQGKAVETRVYSPFWNFVSALYAAGTPGVADLPVTGGGPKLTAAAGTRSMS